MIKRTKSLIRKRILKSIQPVLESMIAGELIHNNPFITGKLYPFNTATTDYVVKAEKPTVTAGRTLPVPPKEFWEGYADTEESYLEGGQRDMTTLLSILNKINESPLTLSKVLDLGCAAGRMLRHYPVIEGKSELWGSDINAKYINWCQQSFPEPFFFLTNTTTPHLPFEDGSFDLVYCGSVFTHITDIADAWFLEIKRILRKGGYAYITIHDEHTLDLMFSKYKDDPLFFHFVEAVRQFYVGNEIQSQDYVYFSIFSDPVSQIFYNRQHIIKKWSRFLKLISVTPEAHDHQTAILFQK